VGGPAPNRDFSLDLAVFAEPSGAKRRKASIVACSGIMRATKFDPERTNNSPSARPDGQADVHESNEPAAVRPAPPAPAAEPIYRATGEPSFHSPAPAPPAPFAPRLEPPRTEPVRPALEPPRPAPQYRPAAPSPPRYAPQPQPEPPPVRQAAPALPAEPLYRSTALPQESRPEPPRFVPPPQPRASLPAPVEAPPMARAPAPSPARSLPTPGFARGLPAPAPAALAPVAAPAPPLPAPAAPVPPPLPAPGFARGLPSPAAAAPAPAPPASAPAFPQPRQAAHPAPPARFGPGLPAPAALPPPTQAPRLAAPVVNGASPSSAFPPAVRPARPRTTGPLEVGRVRYEDLPAILDLVNADLLPGQPGCGRHVLDMAMRGESPVDAAWWRELSNVKVAVARRGGEVAGAVSYAIAAADRSGWLHAREDRRVVEPLLDHVMNELAGSSHMYAFWIASALSLGLEALPVEQRPVTNELLTSRGLMGRDSWRYLVLPMDRFTPDGAEDVATVRPTSGPGETPSWLLVMGDREEPLASAEIALAGDGCGVLWWIDVEPAQRGQGIGRRLLRQALRFLAMRGAETVAASVDHADPRERDPSAILRLLGSAGFQEVDRLWSYESPRRRR